MKKLIVFGVLILWVLLFILVSHLDLANACCPWFDSWTVRAQNHSMQKHVPAVLVLDSPKRFCQEITSIVLRSHVEVIHCPSCSGFPATMTTQTKVFLLES